MGIKQYVQDWMAEKWENWVKKPIANQTQAFENQAINTTKPHLETAKANLAKPADYYWKQAPFYRGLFWIGVGCLIVLWIISGS